MNDEDKKIIDSLKLLSLDIIATANSGHPGIALGAAPIIYTLFANHLNINPSDSDWLNRDRFVLSAGHGSALLYSTLLLAGYNLDINELKNFRRLNSKTPGHPEYGTTDGVDMTTGPLGQGIASAVGMAMAERYLSAKLNTKENELLNYYTYVLCSDGDLMEGISTEAASLAGTLKLNKLIVLYDSNNVCLDGSTKKVFTENVLDKFKALGWYTQTVKNGEDIKQINKAINNAKKINQPTIIEVKTIIGKGSINEGTSTVHGKPLDKEDLIKLKQKLNGNGRDIPFAVSKESADLFRKMINDRMADKIQTYNDNYQKLDPNVRNEITRLQNREMNPHIDEIFSDFKTEPGRISSGKVLNTLADHTKFFLGGSADLSSSTKTYLTSHKEFSSADYSGKNINFGVREHAMGAILNGMALSNLRVFGSTFLAFADYLKPAIRLAAIMKLPVIYVFTHDSISNSQDGPTHQAIEQLAMLRSIPNLDVYRPADSKEVLGSYVEALKKTDGPSAIVVSRSDLKLQLNTDKNIATGGYVVKRGKGTLDGIIIATGKELAVALEVSDNLEAKSKNLRVVSMPNVKAFFNQSGQYINEVLPPNKKIIVIEAASSYGWHKLTTSRNIIAIDTFGKSGTEEELIKEFKFDAISIQDKIEKLLI